MRWCVDLGRVSRRRRRLADEIQEQIESDPSYRKVWEMQVPMPPARRQTPYAVSVVRLCLGSVSCVSLLFLALQSV